MTKSDLISDRGSCLFHVKHSFADTKVAKNHVQHILHIDPSNQPPQSIGSEPKFFCDDVLPSSLLHSAGSSQRIRALP